MRVDLLGEPGGVPSGIKINAQFQRLLAEHQILRGVIRRVAPPIIFLQLEETTVLQPVKVINQELSSLLKEGFQVELTRADSKTIALRVLTPFSSHLEQNVEVSIELDQVLVELNIPSTQDTLAVAQGLLERGLSLRKNLIWTLLPWAERGQLDEAFQLLQAKFPLVPDLINLVAELKNKGLHQSLRHEAKGELPSELREAFKAPSWEGRSLWNDQFQEGEIFKDLMRLLVGERFVEAILNWENESSVVFALPFLRGQDLYASWVRIARDEESQYDSNSEEAPKRSFLVELAIPTTHLGLVGAEMRLGGGIVSITFRAEDYGLSLIEEYIKSLEQDLSALDWTVREIKVGGWDDHAQSSCFTI